MLRRIAERSRAIVVHNPGAAALVRQHAPGAEIVTIPHLFEAPHGVDPASALEFRLAHGIPTDSYLFGIFGFLRESKRLLQLLEVFTAVREVNPRVSLLVAGDIISSDLERACGPLLRAPGVFRVPYLPERDFWTAASAIDACVNLRVPPAGETSGIAIRMMGIGKPVILTDSAENAEFPKGTFLPIPSGVAERATLFDYICILARDPVLSLELGRTASAHIRGEHAIARVSDLYWDLLCKHAVCSSPS
jgi:hypothetical protein